MEAEGFLSRAASMSYTMKYGKKQSVPDESRRDTYLQSQQTAGGLENSVLNTFNTDRKQLMPVCILYCFFSFSMFLV